MRRSRSLLWTATPFPPAPPSARIWQRWLTAFAVSRTKEMRKRNRPAPASSPQYCPARHLFQIDRSAALRRTTRARNAVHILGKVIVKRDLLAFLDGPLGHVEDMVLKYPGIAVWVAGVIHIFRSAPAHRPVQSPIGVESEHVV